MSRGYNHPEEIKLKACKLRSQGFSYSEIQAALSYPIPKNTLSGWFRGISLSKQSEERIIQKIRDSGARGIAKAWEVNKAKRERLINDTLKRLSEEIKNIDELTAKIILSILYLGEGRKKGGFISFGNSDPKIIKLFLSLLRSVFVIDENKLRGNVQYRADQDLGELKAFWSNETKIPLSQFHKGLMDKRTIDKPTKRLEYKGVFVVIYCSSAIFLELKLISDIIYTRLK